MGLIADSVLHFSGRAVGREDSAKLATWGYASTKYEWKEMWWGSPRNDRFDFCCCCEMKASLSVAPQSRPKYGHTLNATTA